MLKQRLWGKLFWIYEYRSRFQWPYGLGYVQSSTARILGSWIRIPLQARLCSFFFVLSRVGGGLATGWYPVQGVLSSVQKQIHKIQKSNSESKRAREPNPNLQDFKQQISTFWRSGISASQNRERSIMTRSSQLDT